jgi:hypothetical protein
VRPLVIWRWHRRHDAGVASCSAIRRSDRWISSPPTVSNRKTRRSLA